MRTSLFRAFRICAYSLPYTSEPTPSFEKISFSRPSKMRPSRICTRGVPVSIALMAWIALLTLGGAIRAGHAVDRCVPEAFEASGDDRFHEREHRRERIERRGSGGLAREHDLRVRRDRRQPDVREQHDRRVPRPREAGEPLRVLFVAAVVEHDQHVLAAQVLGQRSARRRLVGPLHRDRVAVGG